MHLGFVFRSFTLRHTLLVLLEIGSIVFITHIIKQPLAVTKYYTEIMTQNALLIDVNNNSTLFIFPTKKEKK